MHVVDAHPLVEQVVGKVLGHALGERGHQHALLARRALLDLGHKVVDLATNGTYVDLGVKQARGANDLFHLVLRHTLLVVARRCRYIDKLRHARLKLVKAQRTVVQRGGQTEPVIHERDLARAVTFVHATNLRHRHMALVDNAEHVARKVVNKRVGRLARLAPVQVTRVVFDARAKAHVFEHLQIVGRTLRQPLCLQDAIGRRQLLNPALHLGANGTKRMVDLGPLGHVVRSRPNGNGVKLAHELAGDHVDFRDELDLIAKEANAKRVFGIRREHIHHVPAHTKRTALQVHVVAVVLNVYELVD